MTAYNFIAKIRSTGALPIKSNHGTKFHPQKNLFQICHKNFPKINPVPNWQSICPRKITKIQQHETGTLLPEYFRRHPEGNGDAA
jgi:hypothetical protein